MKRIRHGRQSGGFSLLDAIVLAAILAVLAAMLVPAWNASRKRGCRVSCANNVKQIVISFRSWAVDHNGKFPMQVSVTNGGTKELIDSGTAYAHFRVLSNELNTPMILVCWEDTKTLNEAGKVMAARALARGTNRGYSPPFFPANFPVSYFVGVDAQPDRPKMFLSGDDNFEIGGVPVKSGLLELSTTASVAWTSARHTTYKRHFWNATTSFGYVGLADGSVRHTTISSRTNLVQRSTGTVTTSLTSLLQATGVATNRLAMP
jgi:type II secretory pathway pseudopilin PulG